MEPEPDRVDLSVLDPTRHTARWNGAVANVAARAFELRRLRRAVVRRGVTALALAAAAALVLCFAVPKREAYVHAPQPQIDVLDWATRGVTSNDMLELGVGHAQ